MGRIHLSGRLICANAGDAAIVRRHLPAHLELTRAEPGCISFDVVPSDDELIWTVTELFSDAQAFASHGERAAASDWGRATAGIERRYSIHEMPAAPGRE